MQERGGFVDHTMVHRWAIKMFLVLTAIVRRRKRALGRNWSLDETYIKVFGEWKYLYHAVDTCGDKVNFLYVRSIRLFNVIDDFNRDRR